MIMNKLTHKQLGWLEALIDGEGGFCMWVNKGTFNFNIQVAIHNTCLPLLKKVKSIIGDGSIRKQGKPSKKHYKQCYTYKFSYKTLKLLLPKLRLIVKEKQRKITIQALRWSSERQRWGRWYRDTNIKYLTRAMNNIKRYNNE